MVARKIPVLVVSGSIPLPFTMSRWAGSWAFLGRARDVRSAPPHAHTHTHNATVPEWSKGVDSRPTGFVRASSNLVGRKCAARTENRMLPHHQQAQQHGRLV